MNNLDNTSKVNPETVDAQAIDPRIYDAHTDCGPQMRAAIQSADDRRRFAALVIAFMDSNDVKDMNMMSGMLGISHEELLQHILRAEAVLRA